MVHGSLQAIGPEKYPSGKRVTARRSDHWVETRRNFPLAWPRPYRKRTITRKLWAWPGASRLPRPSRNPCGQEGDGISHESKVGRHHPRKRLDELAKGPSLPSTSSNRGKGEGPRQDQQAKGQGRENSGSCPSQAESSFPFQCP